MQKPPFVVVVAVHVCEAEVTTPAIYSCLSVI